MRHTLPLHRAALWGSARPPQAADLQIELLLTMRALGPNQAVAVFVNPPIEILEVFQIAGEQSFDHFRVYVLQRSEPDDHPRQQDDQQVSWIALHARILQRRYFIEGGGQPHHTLTVQIALAVAVAHWQRERKFRLQHEAPLLIGGLVGQPFASFAVLGELCAK